MIGPKRITSALLRLRKDLWSGKSRIGVTVESLGILYRDKGDYARAEPYFLRAVAITEKSLGRIILIRQAIFATWASLRGQGRPCRRAEDLTRSNEIEEKNLPLNLAIGSERQKLAYFDPMAEDLERLISFQAQQDAGDSQARDLAATR